MHKDNHKKTKMQLSTVPCLCENLKLMQNQKLKTCANISVKINHTVQVLSNIQYVNECETLTGTVWARCLSNSSSCCFISCNFLSFSSTSCCCCCPICCCRFCSCRITSGFASRLQSFVVFDDKHSYDRWQTQLWQTCFYTNLVHITPGQSDQDYWQFKRNLKNVIDFCSGKIHPFPCCKFLMKSTSCLSWPSI
jgi:hypothetical protein